MRREWSLQGGTLRPACEIPERVELILREMRARGFEAPKAAESFGVDAIRAVHVPGLIDFLQSIYAAWEAKYPGHHAIPGDLVRARNAA